MPRPRLETSPWWPAFLELKDTLPLHALAERFGVSTNGLSRALKRNGITRPRVRGATSPTTRATPGRRLDPRSAEAQSWWPQFMELKDKRSLAQLAKKFGVAEITLQRALRRTGVQRKSQRGARGGKEARKAARKIGPLLDLLGALPDGEVARRAGVSRYAVAQYRKKKGIQSVKAQSAELSVPPIPRPSTRPAPLNGKSAPKTLEAYVVRVALGDEPTRRSFVVIGQDLADAATRAQNGVLGRPDAGDWVIESLEYIGPTL